MNPSIAPTQFTNTIGSTMGQMQQNPAGGSTPGSSPWINKLKIVGSGHNWQVAPCEPFYLMGTDAPATEAALTGAKNLIEHYGLGNAYQKFCGKPLREELSAFLPHLSGNVDVPASLDDSGLMNLIERPPIRGKELRPFAPNQLDQAFRLHPGPLPQEYAMLFAAAPAKHPASNHAASHSTSSNSSVATAGPGESNPGSHIPASAAPSLGCFARRRRRLEVHRGQSANSGSANGGNTATVGGTGPLFPTPAPATIIASAGGSVNSMGGQITMTTSGPGTLPNTPSSVEQVGGGSGMGSHRTMEIPPPGLIPVNSNHTNAVSETSQKNPSSGEHHPPPPPLLAPVHQASPAPRPPMGSGPHPDSASASCLPAPPLLHSIHVNSSGATSSGNSSIVNTAPPLPPPPPQIQPMELGKIPSSGSGSPSPDLLRMRRMDGEEMEEPRKKKRKEKKRRKERMD